MEVKNIYSGLENAPEDKSANIKLIKLAGDENISVFGAAVAANSELTPHYHKIGIENYQIIKGSGVMKVGDLEDGLVSWKEELMVVEGDSFSIKEGRVHQIVNNTDSTLIAVFTCPEAHLGEDRYFIS